ncbi:MAG: ABC transporter substrate-binding protein [Actinobacteria bacterium]|nr:ABC transporter substrate-binding protein [Actinomycetota bacterium]NBY15451.1 ABC transporter substrate-binding protein [Actinomycetota bacterium]
MSTKFSGQVRIDKEPQRIISLSPTATEALFAVGAGDQVIAVDDQSNYPDDAPKSDLSGYTPNVEAILAKKPDLVIVSNDINNIVASLRAAKVPVLIEPAAKTLDDAYFQILEIGIATAHDGDSTGLVNQMKQDITDAQAKISSSEKKLSFYHELDNTYYSVTSDTFLGALYKMAGLKNIADAAPGADSGYPQLSAEYIVKANPDFIFLADTKCCSVTAASLKDRPGFAALDAVKNGKVIELDDDVASRWGPRTVELFKQIVDAVTAK